jgi:hypothetical protein
MHVSMEQATCLRLMLQKGFACQNCGSSFFIVRGARWPTGTPPALEVDLRCASCGAGATASVSLQEARRCGFDELN